MNIVEQTQAGANGIVAPKLVKKKVLAEMIGVSPRTIDDWVAKRVIPYIAPGSRLHLFDPDAVRRAIIAKYQVKERPARS